MLASPPSTFGNFDKVLMYLQMWQRAQPIPAQTAYDKWHALQLQHHYDYPDMRPLFEDSLRRQIDRVTLKHYFEHGELVFRMRGQ